MLDKIFKIATITIAIFLVGFTIFTLFVPTQTNAQITKSNLNAIIPESHEWEVVASGGGNVNGYGYALLNKRTGEFYVYNAGYTNPFAKLK